MENYRVLAVRYLKLNKRRTILTILGTALTVFVLYILLNAGFSYMDYMKEEIIECGDYEMILYTESEEQIQDILSDSVVKRAYVGKWSHKSTDIELSQALFVTGNNPYRINKNFKYLTTTYGLEGEINEDLAAFYLQGNGYHIIYIVILFFFLVSYLFAIFGVGVIRNSIQLSLFEQIKDYGNLRCIGACISQLRAIIYLQGFIMEIAGLTIGIVSGQVLLWLAGLFINFSMKMHILPILLIAIAYFGDLYFAMEENCKLVTGMSPMSALKGEFRIRKEKIKVRKKSIYGRIFGMEGDYAYKSLMRSPGKFYKSVGAMFIGITAVIACFGAMKLFEVYKDDIEDISGYYQVEYVHDLYWGEPLEVAQKNLPDEKFLMSVAEHERVTSVRKMYQTSGLLVDDNAIRDHLTAQYRNNGSLGTVYENFEDEREDTQTVYKGLRSQIMIYGYNEEDYARYEKYLVAGTLNVSDNGIVVVNGTKTMVENIDDQGDTMYTATIQEMEITDYQLGDTIEMVDVEKLNAMMIEAMEGRTGEDSLEDGVSFIVYRARKLEECKQILIEQGDCHTYVIEGILERDINMENPGFSIVLPLERYYEMTGQDENSVVGIAYHIEGDLSSEDYDDFYYYTDEFSDYPEYISFVAEIENMKNIAKYVLAFMLFVATVSSVNIINTTASNIHMRRKEFAQLRVIGVSKKQLIKMVMLEGVITTIMANLLGCIVGNHFSYGVYYYMKMFWDVHYTIPWLGMFLGLFLSILVLCGSVYVPLITMKHGMAEELAASGE